MQKRHEVAIYFSPMATPWVKKQPSLFLFANKKYRARTLFVFTKFK